MPTIRTLLGGLIFTLFLPHAAEAHEKWFIDPATRGEVPDLFRSLTFQTWTAIGATALLFAACVVADRAIRRLRITRRFAGRIRSLYPWAPTILGVAAGIGIGWFALDRAVLAPNILAPDTLAGTVFVALECAAAILLILGFFSRLAAGLLLVMFAVGFAWYPFRDAIEQIHFLGIAIFIFAWGRGRLSLGSGFSRLVASAPSHIRPAAALALRVTLGLGLIILALGKVLRPDLHLNLLEAFPWNPLSVVHQVLPTLTPDWYLFGITLVEALLGLLVLLGRLLRPLAALLVGLFIIGATFLPLTDLLGHLPYIGAAAALAILGRTGEKEYAEVR